MNVNGSGQPLMDKKAARLPVLMATVSFYLLLDILLMATASLEGREMIIDGEPTGVQPQTHSEMRTQCIWVLMNTTTTMTFPKTRKMNIMTMGRWLWQGNDIMV